MASASVRAEQRRQVEARTDGDMLRLVGGDHQHEVVAQQVLARVGDDQLLVGQVVHPLLIGGGEQIGGRALLDLSRQRGAGAERQAQRRMPRLRPLRRDVLHRIGQAGGGEYRQFLGARRKRRKQQAKCQQEAHR